MKKPDWKPFMLPQSAYYREINIQGRKVQVSVSPYEIPEAYRIWVDKDKSILFIELKYIEQETELVPIHLPTDITCFVGKITNRVYKLEVKVDPQMFLSDELAILQRRTQEIIDALGPAASGKIKKVNSELVQSGIASNAPEIEKAY